MIQLNTMTLNTSPQFQDHISMPALALHGSYSRVLEFLQTGGETWRLVFSFPDYVEVLVIFLPNAKVQATTKRPEKKDTSWGLLME